MSRVFSPWSLCATLALSIAAAAIPPAPPALGSNVNFNFNATDEGWVASGSADPFWKWDPGPSVTQGAWQGFLNSPSGTPVAYLTSPLLVLDQEPHDDPTQPWVHVDISHEYDFPSNVLGQVQFRYEQAGVWSLWTAVPNETSTTPHDGWYTDSGHDWPTASASSPLVAGPAFEDKSTHYSGGGHLNSAFQLLWADYGTGGGLFNGDMIQFRFALAQMPSPSLFGPASPTLVWEVNKFQIEGVHVVPEPGSLAMAASAAGLGLGGLVRRRSRSRRATA